MYPDDCKEVKSCRILCNSLETSGLASCGGVRLAVVGWVLDGWERGLVTARPRSRFSWAGRGEAVLMDVALDLRGSLVLAGCCCRDGGREE